MITNSDKPLFSKPFLAALTILVTLLIWLLNLTAPTPRYPQMQLESWQTESGVPITWLNQEAWQGTNKLEVRIRFNHGRVNDDQQGLTDALFALLLLDTFPLSTTSVNKRLETLGAKVNFHVSEDDSELAITLNSEGAIFDSTLETLSSWLQAPDFKTRSFIRWQNSAPPHNLSPKAQLTQQLYPVEDMSTLGNLMQEYSLTLEDIQAHYKSLLYKIDKIILVGNLPDKQSLQQHLDILTSNLRTANSRHKVVEATQPALHTQEGAILLQSHAAASIKPLHNVKDWISLQIWLPFFLLELNQKPNIEYAQLHLERSHLRQWIWWSVQYQQSVLQSSDGNALSVEQDAYATKELFLQSIHNMDESSFDERLAVLQDKIATQSLSPTWWARIASQETPAPQKLNLATWLESYSEALERMSFQDYKSSIDRIVNQHSYQEIQLRE